MTYPRLAGLKSFAEFRARLAELGLDLPCHEHLLSAPEGPLAQPYPLPQRQLGNRFCILPMEGWDGTPDGRPSPLTHRRWQRFGQSGAQLIWGGEAVAVRLDGRANPRQLLLTEENLPHLAALAQDLLSTHRARFPQDPPPLLGLQLTHSGRFAHPTPGSPAPRIVYRHPLLDRRTHITDDRPLLSDDELDALVDDFVVAARRARQAGFDFVDIKHCHGYLGHELLSACDRTGPYGGSLEHRTRFLRQVVAGIRATVPELALGVRVSIFDTLPYQPGPDGVGQPLDHVGPYRYAFGCHANGLDPDLTQPAALMEILQQLGIQLVCTTAGSPYYNPHVQRPAAFPPSDGYLPPEDPLVGVARQIRATAELRSRFPRLCFVGSGYSYLQEWLPHVAQAVVARQQADFVGLGRMALSYPELPADVLAGQPLRRKLICRTFSECTTAPRQGRVSGCYPLDAFYKQQAGGA